MAMNIDISQLLAVDTALFDYDLPMHKRMQCATIIKNACIAEGI
jgi:hypothetical protein